MNKLTDWKCEARATRVANDTIDRVERERPGTLAALGFAGMAIIKDEMVAALMERDSDAR